MSGEICETCKYIGFVRYQLVSISDLHGMGTKYFCGNKEGSKYHEVVKWEDTCEEFEERGVE